MALSASASTFFIVGKMQATMQGSVLMVEPDSRPVGHKRYSDFTPAEESSHASSHEVTKGFLKTAAGLVLCFLKKNPNGTAISELEATAANFSRVLAPSYAPRTFAVYDDDKYIGVASQEMREFKTLTEDPLTASDLDTSFLQAKNIS